MNRPTGKDLDELIEKTLRQMRDNMVADGWIACPSPESTMAETIKELEAENDRLREEIKVMKLRIELGV